VSFQYSARKIKRRITETKGHVECGEVARQQVSLKIGFTLE